MPDTYQLPAALAARLREQRIAMGLGDGDALIDPSIIDIIQQTVLHTISSQTSSAADITPVLEPLRYGLVNNSPLSLGTQSVLILPKPSTFRTLFFLVNTHATQTLFVAFGRGASAGNGLPLGPGGFVGFDSMCPQDDIYAIGSGAATTAVLLYSNKA